MAGLLVSVRSAAEALAAIAGGVTVLDVKEPDRGPLGRADPEVWAAVARLAPAGIPVSVALGELREWDKQPPPRSESWAGITYRKLGLAGSGPDGTAAWMTLRQAWGPGPRWVAVAYADWAEANAPDPDQVLDMAISAPDCVGILVDTWSKLKPSPVDLSWSPWIERARKASRFVALAGGLDESAIARLAPLNPHVFAVRGSACQRGLRTEAINSERVSSLVRAARDAGRVPARTQSGQWG
ncbi:(5-formylfuran-3-yl)methyl phosphate synthase [Isosphaeraceae bacterium EP7]